MLELLVTPQMESKGRVEVWVLSVKGEGALPKTVNTKQRSSSSFGPLTARSSPPWSPNCAPRRGAAKYKNLPGSNHVVVIEFQKENA